MFGREEMFKKGIKLIAGILVTAIAVTTVLTESFFATVEDTYVWDMSVGFTAGAHHAIEETVAITDKEEEYIVIAIENGEVPWVTQARIEEEEARRRAEEEARRKAEEEARRKAEEEAARLAAEEAARRAEAARLEEIRRQQREEAKRKNYVAPTGGTGQDVVNYAVQFVGNPYVLGGSSLTDGIDCSNFVMRIYEAFGVSLPHNSYKLRDVGYEVSASEIKAGDIICYQGHVSIYMGDGRCVHAANSEDGIKISPKWNYTHVITIRRIFND